MNTTTDETARRCRRCAAVLPARSRGSTCPACMLSATSRFGGEELVEMAVEKSPALVFGDYLLEEELAHGGMGVV